MKLQRRSFLKMLGLGPPIARFAPASVVEPDWMKEALSYRVRHVMGGTAWNENFPMSGATEPKWTASVTKDGNFEWTAIPDNGPIAPVWQSLSKFHPDIDVDKIIEERFPICQ
jgi:hypothetical protein